MKLFATLLLLASLALNAAFLTGCITPKTFGLANGGPESEDAARLARIASSLGIPTENKTSFDLENAILATLRHEVAVPPAYDEASFEKMVSEISIEQENVVREYQEFIEKLQGKRVIAVGGED